MGAVKVDGRPVRTVKGKQVHVHRDLWFKKYGMILGGLHLRRMCEDSLCVNPDHWTLKGSRLLVKRLGRTKEELYVAMRLLQRAASQAPGDVSWRGEGQGPWRLSQLIVADLADATGIPPLVLHTAYSELERASSKSQARQHQKAMNLGSEDESLEAAERGRAYLEGKPHEIQQDGWLPPID